jgi:hypothetical protein
MTAMDRIGDCGNGYDPPCPPGIENDFYLMAAAVISIAVGSMFRQRAIMVPATVTALRDTGTTVDDNPQAAITVRYTRRDGTTSEVETVQVVPRLEVPRRGDPATVWYDTSTDKAIVELGGSESRSAPTTLSDTP